MADGERGLFKGGVEWINERYHIPLVLVSMGKQGSRAYYNNMMVEAAPFLQKDTIETTGAGDTFCGCMLHYICEHEIYNLTKDNLQEMLVYANAAASLVTTRKGALMVMPDGKEVEKMLAYKAETALEQISVHKGGTHKILNVKKGKDENGRQ